MPAAAKAPRRPEGWLRAQVRATLIASNAPISAHQIGVRIRDDHPAVYASSVFRAVNRMMEDGEIDRVELVAGYVLKRPGAMIAMLCRQCGGCALVDGKAPTHDLDALSQPSGFKPNGTSLKSKGFAACAPRVGGLVLSSRAAPLAMPERDTPT